MKSEKQRRWRTTDRVRKSKRGDRFRPRSGFLKVAHHFSGGKPVNQELKSRFSWRQNQPNVRALEPLRSSSTLPGCSSPTASLEPKGAKMRLRTASVEFHNRSFAVHEQHPSSSKAHGCSSEPQRCSSRGSWLQLRGASLRLKPSHFRLFL